MKRIEQGKLIVIEGVDGSGKTTQTQFLIERLRSIGKKVETIKYPRHNTPFFGLMVDDYLNGKFGSADKLNPYLASLIFACDRWETKNQLVSWLSVGTWVIPDRYMTSNLGHQLGKIRSATEKEKYLQWETTLEYKIFNLPQPDLVLYLDMPIDIIQNLLANRSNEGKEYSKGKKDGHESNINHLKQAQEAYNYCQHKFNNWIKIDCVKDDKLINPQDIHKLIWEQIRSNL